MIPGIMEVGRPAIGGRIADHVIKTAIRAQAAAPSGETGKVESLGERASHKTKAKDRARTKNQANFFVAFATKISNARKGMTNILLRTTFHVPSLGAVFLDQNTQ